MKGYKGMDDDMSCRGFKFEIGKTYHAEGDICLCKNGFHFCKQLYDVFRYYPEGRYFEIEASGDILSEGNKSVASVIKVMRELPDDEINRCKYGDGNSYGYRHRYIYGDGYGNGNGDGYGDGNRYGYRYGDGYGYRYGNGDGYGDRYGNGDGDGYGYGNRSFQMVGMYI